jgi:hypothetical protein
MKTAMQELIDLMFENKLHSKLDILAEAYILRQKEKDQITNAYKIGYSNCYNENPDDTDVYYENTFHRNTEAGI